MPTHHRGCYQVQVISSILNSLVSLWVCWRVDSWDRVERRNNEVQYNMVLHTSLQELRQSIRVKTHKRHPIPCPNRRAMGVSFVKMMKKFDRIIKVPHCTWVSIMVSAKEKGDKLTTCLLKIQNQFPMPVYNPNQTTNICINIYDYIQYTYIRIFIMAVSVMGL